MSFSQTDLDNLDRAIAKGGAVLKVKYADKEVTYRSLDEMMRARELMLKEIGTVPKTRRLFATTSKGHD